MLHLFNASPVLMPARALRSVSPPATEASHDIIRRSSPVTNSTTLDQVKVLVAAAARAASDKQGEDTIVLAVGELIGITDAFVVTSGANTRQVRTIADEVELKVKG